MVKVSLSDIIWVGSGQVTSYLVAVSFEAVVVVAEAVIGEHVVQLLMEAVLVACSNHVDLQQQHHHRYHHAIEAPSVETHGNSVC